MNETCEFHRPPQTACPAAPDRHRVRLGILGGGQLARMTALAAAALGCEVAVLEKTPRSPAAQLAPDSLVGDWNDPATLLKFAARCDVITLENEFVAAPALAVLENAGYPVFPGAACLAITQDKLIQKQTLQHAGLPVPKFRPVDSPAQVREAAVELGWPLLLKTRRNGYDGKGNFTVRSAAEVETGWQALDGGRNPLFVEAFCHFRQELAVIVTVGRNGQTEVYPVVETIQQNHVCRMVRAPAALPGTVAEQAAAMARQAVQAVGGIGSFGVELFLTNAGEILINELAPRVHNSGHYTIEACHCSQFENHVRAVLGWPLGNPEMIVPAAVMVNLLGTQPGSGQPRGLDPALRQAGARVHLYGKSTSDAGRKMGHVTALADSLATAQAMAERAAASIHFGNQL